MHSLKLLGNLFYLIVLARLIAFVEKQGGPISHPINVFKAAVRRAPSLRELNSVGKFNRGNEPKAQKHDQTAATSTDNTGYFFQ